MLYFIGDVVKIKDNYNIIKWFRGQIGLVMKILEGTDGKRDRLKIMLRHRQCHVFPTSQLETVSSRRTSSLNGVDSNPISNGESIFDENTKPFSASPKDFQKGPV